MTAPPPWNFATSASTPTRLQVDTTNVPATYSLEWTSCSSLLRASPVTAARSRSATGALLWLRPTTSTLMPSPPTPRPAKTLRQPKQAAAERPLPRPPQPSPPPRRPSPHRLAPPLPATTTRNAAGTAPRTCAGRGRPESGARLTDQPYAPRRPQAPQELLVQSSECS